MDVKSPGVATAEPVVDASNQKTIEQLKSFYRGEMSAVETYERALGESKLLAGVADVLRNCQASHQKRVALLGEQLRALGADVPESSGAWGAMVKLLEGAAATLSEKMAISVLEEGEDHGVSDYQSDVSSLAAQQQRLVLDELLPAQLETHRVMSGLKQAVTGGA
jgi:Domain of unknown function (DUF2383)